MDELERTVTTLSDELEGTQAQLRTLVVEFESANEELRTANEEMLSTNEELQSANEELHSVNEELYTVNKEYEDKIDELTQLSDDIEKYLPGTFPPGVRVHHRMDMKPSIWSRTSAALDSFAREP